MVLKKYIVIGWLSLLALMSVSTLQAAEVSVAVASNFSEAIKAIASEFEQRTGHKTVLIFGSTGRHYSQIINGAPFDIFLAADEKRPQLLEKEGVAVPGSRFTYAVGKLILWSTDEARVDPQGEVLLSKEFRRLAIANPKLAPYGAAAEQVLRSLELWDGLRGNMVRGENIGQTFQFVKTENAELGFVALSQVKSVARNEPLVGWVVPQELYNPIRQQAVLLKEKQAAREFLAFVQSNSGQQIIQRFGYETNL